MNGAMAWLPLLGISFGFPTILCGWESVFIFGYFWTRPVSVRFRTPFLALGAVSFFLTAAAGCIFPDEASVLYGKAPSMLFMAGGIFAWFAQREERLRSPGTVVRIIGKHGFSILLIHWYVLHYVVEDAIGLNAASFGVVGGTALTMAATLALSLLAALAVDLTAVTGVEFLCELIIDWIGKMIRKGRVGKSDII